MSKNELTKAEMAALQERIEEEIDTNIDGVEETAKEIILLLWNMEIIEMKEE